MNTDTLRAWAEDARDIADRRGSGPNILLLCASNLTASADEIDRLRALIKDAPHSPQCATRWTFSGREHEVSCDCFKAQA